MNGPLFVDTSAWYATADAGDAWHAAAVRCMRRLVAERRPLVTTNHIVDATSFVTMRRLRIQEAFAFDHHFAVLGFTLRQA